MVNSRHNILKGQTVIAVIWSRNIAATATAAISIDPNAMTDAIHENKEQANAPR